MAAGQKTIMEKTYIHLRDDITFGKLKPGEHLTQNTLGKRYKVSRATVREVVGQLAAQGFLTVERNRGAIVTKLSKESVEIIYSILVRCEPLATGLFVRKGNQSVIKRLDLLNKRMQLKDVKLHYKKWLQLNDDFHSLIYKNCGSSILSQLIDHTRLRVYRFRAVPTDGTSMDIYNRQHGLLIAAMRKGDEIAAERIMAKHLEESMKHRLKVLEQIGPLLSIL